MIIISDYGDCLGVTDIDIKSLDYLQYKQELKQKIKEIPNFKLKYYGNLNKINNKEHLSAVLRMSLRCIDMMISRLAVETYCIYAKDNTDKQYLPIDPRGNRVKLLFYAGMYFNKSSAIADSEKLRKYYDSVKVRKI